MTGRRLDSVLSLHRTRTAQFPEGAGLKINRISSNFSFFNSIGIYTFPYGVKALGASVDIQKRRIRNAVRSAKPFKLPPALCFKTVYMNSILVGWGVGPH
ncbi:hypothetical protein D3C71_1487760 [compost metagenome]